MTCETRHSFPTCATWRSSTRPWTPSAARMRPSREGRQRNSCSWISPRRDRRSKRSRVAARPRICCTISSRGFVSASNDFDVVVIGAGHAGSEAAWAAARLGCRVGLCTLSAETVALMPCNPAIGGTAKGHLVREIDALGGLMGRAIDATGIQFKLLNRSRGPAVWSPRAQADKRRYGAWMREALESHPNITFLFRRAGRVLTERGRVTGLAFEEGDAVTCRGLVVTTGTFLNGLVHVGDEQRPSGRAGEPPTHTLAESLRHLGLEMGRLKTGTPPRLDRR